MKESKPIKGRKSKLTKLFTKHNDAGHGWLEVSYKDVTDLNIQNDISEFSYIKLNTIKKFNIRL